jgi:K+-transporting ATPase KdpF subunit
MTVSLRLSRHFDASKRLEMPVLLGIRIVSRLVRVASGPLPRLLLATNDDFVIENLVAAVIGLALVVYLAYALIHPERF